MTARPVAVRCVLGLSPVAPSRPKRSWTSTGRTWDPPSTSFPEARSLQLPLTPELRPGGRLRTCWLETDGVGGVGDVAAIAACGQCAW